MTSHYLARAHLTSRASRLALTSTVTTSYRPRTPILWTRQILSSLHLMTQKWLMCRPVRRWLKTISSRSEFWHSYKFYIKEASLLLLLATLLCLFRGLAPKVCQQKCLEGPFISICFFFISNLYILTSLISSISPFPCHTKDPKAKEWAAVADQ